MFMQLSPKERFGYVALAAIVLVGAGFVVGQRLRRPAAITLNEVPQAGIAVDSRTTPSQSEAQTSRQIIVHVVGAVSRPGLVALAPGSRLYEAIQSAGGFTADARQDGVNLAAKVQDGSQIVVPSRQSSSSTDSVMPGNRPAPTRRGRKQPTEIVNINTADSTQLSTLPGIGQTFAQKIVDYRTEHGPFLGVDDLLSVHGFGKRRLDEIRQWVTVE